MACPPQSGANIWLSLTVEWSAQPSQVPPPSRLRTCTTGAQPWALSTEIGRWLSILPQRSGGLRRTPLTVHQVGGQRYLIGGFPAADWIRNVRITTQGTLTTSDETEVVRLVELDPAEAGPILRECPRTTPEGVQVMLDVGLISAPTPEELTGLAGVPAAFRRTRRGYRRSGRSH